MVSEPTPHATLYKILPATDWARWQAAGQWSGSGHDARDGFVHLSTAGQVLGTRGRHFAGQSGLVLVGLDAARLAAGNGSLRYEASSRGTRYPHWYGMLPLAAVVTEERLG
jgi:uncharacterized protein (DUF952 family)